LLLHRRLRSFPTRRSSDLLSDDLERQLVDDLVVVGARATDDVALLEDGQRDLDRRRLLTAGVGEQRQRKGGADDGRDLKRPPLRSEEHTSELQSRENLVCR